MYNPNPITKCCADCQKEFESLEHHHKEYCSVTCKRRAKAKRVKLSGHADAAAAPEIYPNSNPSVDVLDALAGLCVENPTLDFIFYAVSVEWQPPEGVSWIVKDGSAMLTQA